MDIIFNYLFWTWNLFLVFSIYRYLNSIAISKSQLLRIQTRTTDLESVNFSTILMMIPFIFVKLELKTQEFHKEFSWRDINCLIQRINPSIDSDFNAYKRIFRIIEYDVFSRRNEGVLLKPDTGYQDCLFKKELRSTWNKFH